MFREVPVRYFYAAGEGFKLVILAAPQLPRSLGEFQSHSKVTKK